MRLTAIKIFRICILYLEVQMIGNPAMQISANSKE
jgi:hypothetical protein